MKSGKGVKKGGRKMTKMPALKTKRKKGKGRSKKMVSKGY